MGECGVRNAEVRGSIPLISTKILHPSVFEIISEKTLHKNLLN